MAGRSDRGGLHGVLVVRNEWDVIVLNLLHHFRLGLDRIHVADNGSTDGTSTLLETMARDYPLQITSAPGTFDQKRITNRLIRDARKAGARWIIPIDADEFWDPAGSSLQEIVAGCGEEENGRSVVVQNYFGLINEETPRVGSASRARWIGEELFENTIANCGAAKAGQIPVSLFEASNKCFIRADRNLSLNAGSHSWENMPPGTAFAPNLVIRHVPHRHREIIKRRCEAGRRTKESPGHVPGNSWHLTRLTGMNEAELGHEWRASSVDRGKLWHAAKSYPMRRDDALRRLLQPLLQTSEKIHQKAGVPARLRWQERLLHAISR